MASREVRVVVVGDEKCGKSALIARFISGKVPETYKPTGFDKFPCSVQLSPSLVVHYTVWDTSGSTSYDSVRPLSYSEADIFLVCFSIAEPISLYNVRSHWAVEVGKHSTAPVVLCGCQADLRTDPDTVAQLSRTGRSLVSLEQAVAVSTQIGAECYVETQARLSGLEVREAFRLAAELAAPPPPTPAPALAAPLPRPDSAASSCSSRRGGVGRSSRSLHGSNTSIPREEMRCNVSQTILEHPGTSPLPLSLPTSPARPSLPPGPPLHQRSASQPVRNLHSPPPLPPTPRTASPPPLHSSPPPRSPPPLRTPTSPPAQSQPLSPHSSYTSPTPELRPHLNRKSSFRSSMPAGKPPLPLPLLPKSPTDLALSQKAPRPPIMVGPSSSRLHQLLPPEGKNYESLKSYTSTHSQGSTGSKISTSTSSTSHHGPRDLDVPDTEDPELLRNLDFVSPKAGVYRPVHPRGSGKKDKCSLM